MNPHVRDEVALLVELFITDWAVIWLLLAVDSHVLIQIPSLAESFPTL